MQRLRAVCAHVRDDAVSMPAVERQPAAGPWPSPTEAAAAAAAAGGTGSGGLGFGVVGCGMISGFHAKALDAMDGAQLVACYDAIPAAAEQFGAANGCTVYSDLTAMLSDPAVDVVTICTPSGAHLEPAVAAAQHGKHVVVEKPLEVTLERCDAIIDACDAAGVTLGTILPTRFHESSQKLKEAIEQGRFGTLSLGGAYVKWWRDQEYYDSGAWRGTWAMDGGGALMNQAIHTVDMLSWLMGPVAEVSGASSATLAHERVEVEDTVVATLRFANGALGVVEASTAAYPGAMKRLEICGSGGSALLEEQNVTRWEFAEEQPEDETIRAELGEVETESGSSDPTNFDFYSHQQTFEDLVAAIVNGGQPLIDGIEGRRSVELILAIYEAASTGQSVTLPVR